jgi:hypothetical protein
MPGADRVIRDRAGRTIGAKAAAREEPGKKLGKSLDLVAAGIFCPGVPHADHQSGK